MANPPSSNSELFNGQSIMPSVSRSIGTSSITRAPSSLSPFTIKVLLDAFYDDTKQYPLVIDGMGVPSVELLGMVTNKTLSMDHFTFDLYDGTGSVNVIYSALEHGVSLKLLRSALDASQDAIMDVVTEQIMIGEIYTTIDDCHFKSSRV
ncbi:replication protein a 32 kda subunit a-like isoform x1 [Hordeum vulgare]|nr:replication protein a 32 kda subunit a-like isoform x1 [Hordeum vulgare]